MLFAVLLTTSPVLAVSWLSFVLSTPTPTPTSTVVVWSPFCAVAVPPLTFPTVAAAVPPLATGFAVAVAFDTGFAAALLFRLITVPAGCDGVQVVQFVPVADDTCAKAAKIVPATADLSEIVMLHALLGVFLNKISQVCLFLPISPVKSAVLGGIQKPEDGQKIRHFVKICQDLFFRIFLLRHFLES